MYVRHESASLTALRETLWCHHSWKTPTELKSTTIRIECRTSSSCYAMSAKVCKTISLVQFAPSSSIGPSKDEVAVLFHVQIFNLEAQPLVPHMIPQWHIFCRGRDPSKWTTPGSSSQYPEGFNCVRLPVLGITQIRF
jgi:hypothetical protein